jgi:hypothetical protein
MEAVVQFEGTIYEKGYGLIARTAMRDKTLDSKSKAIYAYICSFASNKNGRERVAFPSVILQCDELGMTEETYYKYRKPLIKKGYLTIYKGRNEQGKFNRNIYTVSAVPVPVNDVVIPHLEDPDTNNPGVGNLDTGNPSSDISGNKNNSSISNSSISNSSESKNSKISNNLKDLDLNQGESTKHKEEELFGDLLEKLELPLTVKRLIWDYNLQGYGNGQVPPTHDSLDVIQLEKFYNTNAYIRPMATKRDVDYVSDHEFYQIVEKIIHEVRPVKRTIGILKKYTLTKLKYKEINQNEHEATSRRMLGDRLEDQQSKKDVDHRPDWVKNEKKDKIMTEEELAAHKEQIKKLMQQNGDVPTIQDRNVSPSIQFEDICID